MKNKRQRAYGIWVNEELVEVVGGEKPGRYYSQAYENRKKVRTSRRVQKDDNWSVFKSFWKFMCWVIPICYFISTLEYGYIEPPKEVEAVEEVKQEFPSEFVSADIPADYDLFVKYFGNKSEEARKVAQCESSMRNITSKKNGNGTYDYGQFQINSIWLKVYNLTPEQLLDPEVNIATAKKIYDRTNNWNAWKYSRKCHGL